MRDDGIRADGTVAGVRLSRITRLERGGSPRIEEDALAEEAPLELRIDGEPVATILRTPGNDAVLALGYLFAEGIVRSLDEISSIAHCGRPGDQSTLTLTSSPGRPIDLERALDAHRLTAVSSACGACGRATLDALKERLRPLPGGAPLSPEFLWSCVERLSSAQPRFAKTGGIHAAAAFDREGRLLASHEDVGRHNAVDKVVGELLKSGRLGQAALLTVSGRAGFEIVQKAVAAGIPVLASVSAPSSLAVELADSFGICLAGFVRPGRMNLYAHPERVGLMAS